MIFVIVACVCVCVCMCVCVEVDVLFVPRPLVAGRCWFQPPCRGYDEHLSASEREKESVWVGALCSVYEFLLL
jgi:hypothetical protein